MSFAREASRAIRSALVLWVVAAIVYPFLMIALGQILFPFQANGSLLKNNTGQVVGSALIGQPFVSDRYFNSRPSTTSYSTADPKKDDVGVLQTGVSGASNLAPSNPALLERVKGKDNPDPSKRVEGDLNRLKTAGVQPTADLVYTSGSSLDPHITPEAARVQVARVAKSRGIEPNQLENLIVQNTENRFLGIFGEPGVNVLQLNLALDQVGNKNSINSRRSSLRDAAR
ncbi:MAG: K(+)-transporting ATPase subunit C [Komarekiella atlantica HA4396-MV6]|jgi:K+-transporting ATPase ATPase C chain|nr:K(+)-transporting ATPase subunit C [Komarekiella atlantica HA4396-MV6]